MYVRVKIRPPGRTAHAASSARSSGRHSGGRRRAIARAWGKLPPMQRRAPPTIAALAFAMCACAGEAPTVPAAVAADDAAPPAGPGILVFTRTAGFRHDSIPVAVRTLRALAAEAGLAVEHSEDPSLFDDATLRRYRAVVFANTTGEVLDPVRRAALERYVGAGGGWLGLHSAADTEYDSPFYGELVGARFASHPPGLQGAHVRFEDAAVEAAFGPWRVVDELYDFRRNPRPWVTVVATLRDRDDRDAPGGTADEDHPIAWCHERLGGRAWYSGLGHDRAIYADPVFRAHLRAGLRYVTGASDRCDELSPPAAIMGG